MAEPIRFSELSNVGELKASAIVAIVQQQNGELVSLKCTMAEVAQLIANGIEFQGLTSDDKKIIGAINEVMAKVDDLELFKFPNVTIIGTPTINHGQISNFSATDFLKFPFLVDFKNQAFDINMAFTTGENVTSQENIFDSDYGLAFAIRNGRFVIAISTNGTTWDLGEGVGSYAVQPNTTYYVRLSWDGSNYKLAYSLDGTSYTDDIIKAGNAQPFPRQIYIGVGENFAAVVNHFTGTINLNKADLRIAGEVVWLGMDDAGLSTRADTSLSNIDAAGEQRIKDIAGGGGEVTKEEFDAEVQARIDGDWYISVIDDNKKIVLVDDVEMTYTEWSNYVLSHPKTIVEYNLKRYFPFIINQTIWSISFISLTVSNLETFTMVGGGLYVASYPFNKITDVKIGSNSLLSGSVAVIPTASTNRSGVVKLEGGYGLKVINTTTGQLATDRAVGDDIDKRSDNYKPIVSHSLDYAVKQAMCDGKGAEWTAAEQAAAQQRIGILSSEGVGF